MGEEDQAAAPAAQETINGLDTEEQKTTQASESSTRHYKWWIQMIVYTIFVLTGQNLGTILGRIYFNNGGKSEWMATLVQVVGFPVLIPLQYLIATNSPKLENPNCNNNNFILNNSPKFKFPLNLASIYIALGIFLAADCMLYSIGLQYLPVTTYTLICASQLGFNALFSYFLNNQKFTPYIVNSLVLLTLSSVLLVFQSDPGDSNKSSKAKYVIGFVCTVAASAGYALMLSVTQVAFQRIIKKDSINAVIEMSIWQCFVASIVIVVGLFASGDWRRMSAEMAGYKSGRVSYAMNLFWTAVSWQAFTVGCTGLIFKVSSLFSNVISILGLPVAPVLAVVFLHDKMTGLKAMSMALALWGFVSYMYQHYVDDREIKKKESN
ncbi:probable purine permease 10 [Andrographis paniculata]|uniref:probable purine permease 10 n=1 Tax=Andrographis paniculata TaxID=175694 RepID=UPI0021E7A685|nr:probable purine permease 10 [Andrographis paniculata]